MPSNSPAATVRAAATAIAHPNIALIKYWGKADTAANVPATPSLSITLGDLRTRTRVVIDGSFGEDRVVVNGHDSADVRIRQCLDRFRGMAGTTLHVLIETDNNFPTAAGLASSASGFAALVTALDAALGLGLTETERAIEARRASASAARSMFGGFASLCGNADSTAGWVAAPIAGPGHWPLAVLIAVCATEAKATSSRDGMRRSAETSPLYNRWVSSAPDDYRLALTAIEQRDFAALAERSEMNCLKMHAVMLSSAPALLYWNRATVDCMHAVRRLRQRGVDAFFTIDAGPQVKVVCLPDAVDAVRAALGTVAGVHDILTTTLGVGARLVDVDVDADAGAP